MRKTRGIFAKKSYVIYNVNMLKKPSFILCVPALLLLGGCNPSLERVTPVALDMGTIVYDEAEISANSLSHMQEISIGTLNDMVSEKKSFLLLVGNQFDCSCWTAFHDEVMVPYLLENHLLLYWVSYFGNEARLSELGLELSSSHETLSIFKDGGLAYQHTTADTTSSWVKEKKVFAAWMDARLQAPRLLSLSKDQLDKKYQGQEDFSIFFSRSTCGDCSYLERNDIKEYFAANVKSETIPENYLYYLDCDQLGIRYVLGDDGKTYTPSSSGEYGEKASAQWVSFKQEYGLAYSEDNPVGWDQGYVPTIYHIHPSNGEKSGDVIDFAGVFYNESIEDGAIKETYFTKERLQLAALDYLSSSSIENKILTRLVLNQSKDKHEALREFESPIIAALLNAIL